MTNGSPGMLVLIAVFAWGIYRRIRRNIGRQKLRPGRIIVSLFVLSLASIIILTSSARLPSLALACSGGMLTGVALSLLGLRHTKFETTEEGHFYTPNTYIGIALTVLLMGRIIYRMTLMPGQTFQPGDPAAAPNMQAFQSPLTMWIIGLTMGYYLAYYIGLFIHTHDRKPDRPSVLEP